MQLGVAFGMFSSWAQQGRQEHNLKTFTRLQCSMKTRGTSCPAFKGKAHNCLVVTRWLEVVTHGLKDTSPYARLRWQVVWGWVEWFEIVGHAPDPDFLITAELQRLHECTNVVLQGSKTRAAINSAAARHRWKMRPKINAISHLTRDALSSGRNPRAWWSFREEELMGKLAKIACAVHALTRTCRRLERWCLQFFSFHSD
jgi:hypothetical protein